MEGASANQRVRVPVKELAAKMATKKEVWDFLTQGCGKYCPSKDTVTIWHLRDLANGSKRSLFACDVEHLYVPQYESLSLEKMIEWAEQNFPRVLSEFLPIERELFKLPRQVSLWSNLANFW